MREVRVEADHETIVVMVDESPILTRTLDLCGEFMLDLDSLVTVLEEITDREVELTERED